MSTEDLLNSFAAIRKQIADDDAKNGIPAPSGTTNWGRDTRKKVISEPVAHTGFSLLTDQALARVTSHSNLPIDDPYKDRTPLEILFAAIDRDDANKTEEYLKKLSIYSRPKEGEHNINSRDEDFAFPHPLLHRAMLAAMRNKTYKVPSLLIDDFGANPNVRDHDDASPLHLVAQQNDHNAYRFLRLRGGNIELENSAHQTPRELLASHNKAVAPTGFAKRRKPLSHVEQVTSTDTQAATDRPLH